MFEMITRARVYTVPTGADPMAALRSRLTEVDTALAGWEVERALRLDQLATLEADRDAAQSDMDTQAAVVETMTERLDDVRDERDGLVDRLNQIDANIEELNAAIEAAPTALLARRMDDAQAEYAERFARLEQVRLNYDAVMASLFGHMDAAGDASGLLAIVIASIASQQEALARIDDIVADLQSEREDLVSTIEADA